jgi:hypothetical protein
MMDEELRGLLPEHALVDSASQHKLNSRPSLFFVCFCSRTEGEQDSRIGRLDSNRARGRGYNSTCSYSATAST